MHSCAFAKCASNNFNNLASNNLRISDSHVLKYQLFFTLHYMYLSFTYFTLFIILIVRQN